MDQKLYKKRDRSILVPFETWFGNAPDLMKKGIIADIGAIAEALIYYDTVIINVAHSEQFHSLFEWFKISDSPQSLLNMMNNGEVFFNHYNFMVNPLYVEQSGAYVFQNIVEPTGDRLQLFRMRVVKSMFRYFNTARKRQSFLDSLEDSVITVEAGAFGDAVTDAHKYFVNENHYLYLIQCIFRSLKDAGFIEDVPDIQIVNKSERNGRTSIEISVDLRKYEQIIGEDFNFGVHTPLAIAATTNRLIWSSKKLRSDLYLNNPTFDFLYNGIQGTIEHFGKTKFSLNKLQMEVDFPDIRKEVNCGNITANDILRIREKSQEFREWLHNQTELDRDILSSYHNTILEKSGLSGSHKKILRRALIVVIQASGVAFGSAIGDTEGAVVGAGTVVASELMKGIYDNMMKEWSPKIFTADVKRIIE